MLCYVTYAVESSLSSQLLAHGLMETEIKILCIGTRIQVRVPPRPLANFSSNPLDASTPPSTIRGRHPRRSTDRVNTPSFLPPSAIRPLLNSGIPCKIQPFQSYSPFFSLRRTNPCSRLLRQVFAHSPFAPRG
ncbi:hypothetical protein B0H19DRAFT_313485 [Mycena capillaripes]|nr:hypothetical protein B0H19DRAFT_313485 [Mycena capillaripes]